MSNLIHIKAKFGGHTHISKGVNAKKVENSREGHDKNDWKSSLINFIKIDRGYNFFSGKAP